jgi:hypothetical protein
VPRKYLLSQYSHSFTPDVKVSEFATLNRRQRTIFPKRDTIFNVAEMLTSSEFAEFETWVNVTLNGGVDSFTGEYWVGDVEETGTLTIVNGEYSFVYESPNAITVSYQLELKNRSMANGEIIKGLFDDSALLRESSYYNQFNILVNENNFA